MKVYDSGTDGKLDFDEFVIMYAEVKEKNEEILKNRTE
jgi:Ca2+-binding EF-hand superfamily protein